MILAKDKAYLARIINYNCKVCCKLKHTFMIPAKDKANLAKIVNYYHKVPANWSIPYDPSLA
jgi:hypothetical protein